MKAILGSGLVGLLARKILGPSYKIVPFSKSRFYSYNPALQDNFLIANDAYKEIIKPYLNSDRQYPYKFAWSIGGILHHQFDQGLCGDWLSKIFGKEIPSHTSQVLKTRFEFEVLDIRLNQLYGKLVEEFDSEIKATVPLGEPIAISNGQIRFEKTAIDYETIVSTIPLDILAGLTGIQQPTPAKDIHYLHVQTGKLDFEGRHQALVADPIFDFYKVTTVAPNRYLFYFHKGQDNPGLYLLNIIGEDFDILEGTSVPRAMPVGNIPNLERFEGIGIYNIGATAQWDWCVDAGSAILRILNFANTGNTVKFKRLK
jgi:hypothetical protein